MSIYHIIQSDWGIGDVICSLYAVQGLSNNKPDAEINLHLRQFADWAELADIPQMKLHRFKEGYTPDGAIFFHSDKDDTGKRIKHTNSPKQLYASKLGVQAVKPSIKPGIIHSPSMFGEKYIIFSPFASRRNRTWEVHNWKILAKMFYEAGYKVIALDGLHQNKRCSEIGVDYFWGQSAEWTAKACFHAAMIISNDSGIAHLGGWLGVKTLVIMSQLLPEQFYDLTQILQLKSNLQTNRHIEISC